MSPQFAGCRVRERKKKGTGAWKVSGGSVCGRKTLRGTVSGNVQLRFGCVHIEVPESGHAAWAGPGTWSSREQNVFAVGVGRPHTDGISASRQDGAPKGRVWARKQCGLRANPGCLRRSPHYADPGPACPPWGRPGLCGGLSSILTPTHSVPGTPVIVTAPDVPRHCPVSPRAGSSQGSPTF